MAYWWVSQNQSYQIEREGQFLWAPTMDRGGRTPYHWATMNEVRAGDVIFSYVGQSIVSVAVAKSSAYSSPRPHEFNAEDVWTNDGKRIDVLYEDLAPTLNIPALHTELAAPQVILIVPPLSCTIILVSKSTVVVGFGNVLSPWCYLIRYDKKRSILKVKRFCWGWVGDISRAFAGAVELLSVRWAC